MKRIPEEDYYKAQIAVLGSVILDSDWAPEVMSRTSPRMWNPTYRPIFELLRRKFAAGEVIDPVTVREALGEDSRDLVMGIMEATPTATNCREYIDLLQESWRLTQLKELGARMQEAAAPEEAEALLAEANQVVCRRERVKPVTLSDALTAFCDRQQEEKKSYLTWGFSKLDDRLYVEGGDFVVLGGYPSDGKTALALSMAYEQSSRHRVGFFSYETRDEKLFDRLITHVARVDFGRVKRRELTQAEQQRLKQESEAFIRRHLELMNASGMTVSDLKAQALARQYEIIYIDYLQLIRPDDPRRSAFDQVTQISRDLHTLAQTTGITVVALSQLTRPDRQGDGGKTAPTMHSLRQSGQLEQDADCIMLLYRQDPSARSSPRLLKVAKNKEGESGGMLTLQFDGAAQTFREDQTDSIRWSAQRQREQTPFPDSTSLAELPENTPVPWDQVG